MSRQEAVAAFLEGRISRRSLVQRLIAGGVTAGAAVSYAHLLKPELAQGRAVVASDHYPMVDMVIKTTSLSNAIAKSRVNVTVTATEELRDTFFRVFVKTQSAGGIPIGQRFVANLLGQGGTRTISIPIDPARLKNRSVATVYVQLQGRDDERYPALASARRKLA